jgi:hypothetical protein
LPNGPAVEPPGAVIRAGGVIASRGLALLAAVGMGVAGCGTGPAAHRYLAGNKARTATTRPSTPSLGSLAARYLLIARPANHRLDVEVDGYGDAERDDLARARADLLAQVATERRFDAGLLRIPFPGRIERTARAMIRANQARIAVTEQQARAGTLAGMRGLDGRHRAADAALEAQVRLIRMFLRLPPPSTS